MSESSVRHRYAPLGVAVLMVCAEGDWHALAARLCTELLRAQGVEVLFLGGSTPAEHVAKTVGQHRPDAVLVSCTIPIFFKGVARITDVVHRGGVPVLAGGRVLQGGPMAARRLAAGRPLLAAAVITRWRSLALHDTAAALG